MFGVQCSVFSRATRWIWALRRATKIETTREVNRKPKMRRTPSIVLAALIGAIAALACVFLGLRMMAPPSLPELTPSRIQAAWDRWETHGPADYDIEVVVSGRQPATYRVQVRDTETVSATRDDYPLKGQRTIGTWSVPGMFNTIEIDLNQRHKDSGATQRGAHRLILGCQFDAEYGYPTRYRRIEIGSRMQVEWQVVALTIVK